MSSNTIAIVLARHTRKPHIEGGGKVMLDVAHALSSVGIKTFLFSFNYANSQRQRIQPELSESFQEFDISMSFLTQDTVLNTRLGAYLSNIAELCVGGIINIGRYIKYVLSSSKGRSVCFIGNASKHLSLVIHCVNRVCGFHGRKVLMLMKRDELHRLSFELVKPHMIVATSRELAELTKRRFQERSIPITHIYPPVDLEVYKPTPLRDTNGLFRELVNRKYILYMGRVNEKRFPLLSLRYLLQALKEADKEAKAVIAIISEKKSFEWSKNAVEIAKKIDATNNLAIITRVLTDYEKAMLYSSASAFIFPSKSPTAIEPPLTVLESIACGTPLITTGASSTLEIARLTSGFIFKDFETLRMIIANVLSGGISKHRGTIRSCVESNFSYRTFCNNLSNYLDLFLKITNSSK